MPAPHLAARHAAAQARCCSGTLSPPQFYRDLLGLPPDTTWLTWPPLAAHQFAGARPRTSPSLARPRGLARPIADLVAAQYVRQPGNYLCFASSFDYLQRVAYHLGPAPPAGSPMAANAGWTTPAAPPSSPALPRAARAWPGQLGGVCRRVDLPGTRLISAFIATLGLPQVNAVNDAMYSIALDEAPRQGYACAYLSRPAQGGAGRRPRDTHRARPGRGGADGRDRFMRRCKALLPRWWQVG